MAPTSWLHRLLLLALASASVGNASAGLVNRGGGMIYDDVLNITWLQDANFAKSSGYDADGLMDWPSSKVWASQLEFAGYSDWRLPTTTLPDLTCFSHGSNVTAENCVGSELGYLFYKTLGNFGASNAPGIFGLTNSGPFDNLAEGHGYWSESEFGVNSDIAWYFHFASGFQAYSDKINLHYALAVRNGDVALIAEPESLALMLVGLAAAILVRRRQRAFGALNLSPRSFVTFRAKRR